MRICSFLMRMTTSSSRTAAPQPSGWSSQERPRSLLFVPTMSITMPEGCVGRRGESWGEGLFFAKAVFLDSLLGFDVMATDARTGNDGHFTGKAVPHILHLRSASVHMLHCLRLQEEASMVVSCGGFGSSLLCVPSHAQPGHVRDRRKALLKARTSVTLY